MPASPQSVTRKRKTAHGMAPKGLPAPNALDAPWQDIRDAIASGLSFGKVAKQFSEYHPRGWEALSEVIRKRAQREHWLVPSTIIGNAKERLAAQGISVPTASESTFQPLRDPKKTGTLVAQSVAEMGEEGSLIASQLALSHLRKAQAKPSQIAPLVDIKDVGAALKIVRTAAGMDRQGPSVSLNLWGAPAAHQGAPREADIRDVTGATLQDWEDE